MELIYSTDSSEWYWQQCSAIFNINIKLPKDQSAFHRTSQRFSTWEEAIVAQARELLIWSF